jgi:hypothetical protein
MAVDGTYNIEFTTPRGNQTGKLSLKTAGSSLSGTYVNDRGTMTLSDGKVTGDDVEFSYTANTPRGELKFAFKGRVGGNDISGQVQIGDVGQAPFTGKRA